MGHDKIQLSSNSSTHPSYSLRNLLIPQNPQNPQENGSPTHLQLGETNNNPLEGVAPPNGVVETSGEIDGVVKVNDLIQHDNSGQPSGNSPQNENLPQNGGNLPSNVNLHLNGLSINALQATSQLLQNSQNP